MICDGCGRKIHPFSDESKIVLQKTLIFASILIGMISLSLVTRNIVLAFFSETKSAIIYINRSGEQYFDILACVIMWPFSISGMGLFLLKARKNE